jgi:hypothetical protein
VDQQGEKQKSHRDLTVQTDTEGHDCHENDKEGTTKESIQKSKVK